jgi:hypothetical protein
MRDIIWVVDIGAGFSNRDWSSPFSVPFKKHFYPPNELIVEPLFEEKFLLFYFTVGSSVGLTTFFSKPKDTATLHGHNWSVLFTHLQINNAPFPI